MSKFILGQSVYIEHPQSGIAPFVIINVKIVGVVKVARYSYYYHDYMKSLNGEKIDYEYRVQLSPSGSQINVNEDEIFSDLSELKAILEIKLEDKKQRLQKEINNLSVLVD
jgi:hypothetical protein